MKMYEIIAPISGMTRPGQPPKPAPNSQTQYGLAPTQPAANIKTSGNQTGTQLAANVKISGNQTSTQSNLNSIDKDELAKSLDQELRKPDISKDFADLLARVLQKGNRP